MLYLLRCTERDGVRSTTTRIPQTCYLPTVEAVHRNASYSSEQEAFTTARVILTSSNCAARPFPGAFVGPSLAPRLRPPDRERRRFYHLGGVGFAAARFATAVITRVLTPVLK